ncbi:hypothetical protein ACLOJK_009848 [Asimina triloba]
MEVRLLAYLTSTSLDLKNLRAQLYSAAEYFELSYNNDDQKHIVVSTLKDYAIQALVNTVDHLGSVTYKVRGLLDEKVDEVSGTELRVSCIEQRLRTCQEYIDREGISQQSLVIATPKYHKRYLRIPLIGLGALWQDTKASAKTMMIMIGINFALEITFSFAIRTTWIILLHRSASPVAGSRPLSRSGSLASRPTTPTAANGGKRFPSAPRKSSSLRHRAESEGQKEADQVPSKSKRLLKALLSRRKSKNDQMLYTYLDEY